MSPERKDVKNAPKVERMSDLVKYQDGAVVSRTLIDKETGNITLFSFDKGEGLSEHTAPFDAFVYILDGTVEIKISGKAHYLNEGDIITMPADEPHSLRAIKPFKMLLVMIKT
jgi:quercetin dioxygenase-like cupin family protein